MKRLLKFLHEVGTVGVMGALMAQMVLSLTSTDLSAEAFAVMRRGILTLTQWLLLPSLAVVLVSGLLAMGLHRPYQSAQWVWIKALMTPLVFEATVLGVQTPARVAAKLAEQLAEGPDAAKTAALERALGKEWWGLWLVLGVYAANVALAIWRPRFRVPSSQGSRASAREAPPLGTAADAAAEASAKAKVLPS